MKKILLSLIFTCFLLTGSILPQQNSATHTRGKLWETLYNWGFIGDPGAWDYTETTGVGFYPGFPGFTYPNNEELANGFITDANFHNFRSGPWIIAKGGKAPTPPNFDPEQKDFLIYHASLATGENGVLSSNPPFVTVRNFAGSKDYNPQLPEEMNTNTFNTSTGITVTQRSMSWSFNGYHDFIIYDYTFKNTGNIVVQSVNKVFHLDQTLNEVWFVFHSGIQVSTKGMLNFHYNSNFLNSAAPAGGFGWHPSGGYFNYYNVENDAPGDGKGLFYFSRHYNGGRAPVPWDNFGIKSNWQTLLRVKPEWQPELQDPSAFGFEFLYRTPPQGAPNTDPFDADPTHFNIYSDEGDKFQGRTVDFETFGLSTFSAKQLYDFATSDKRPANNGNLYCWYTSSFGPYTLAPGDSVRIVLAEVAGVMDMHQVQMGDPNHWFPDSTIAAIRRHAATARNAVKWGINGNANGINMAADVPDAPPAPDCRATNASKGSDSAIVAVQWDKLAEETKYTDGSGGIFFDGSTDVSGYRIYRGNDKRGIWDLVADIPRNEFQNYWRADLNKYEYLDRKLQFGFEFYYYVQAYNSTPKPWTSVNGTKVSGLQELSSDDVNRTPLVSAKPGPLDITKGWDVFAAPNPYIEGDPNHSFGEPTPRKIEFRNLPEKATIKIYTLSGDLIKTLQHGPDVNGNLYGSISWDQRSESGLLVAPGLYIYVVQSQTEGTMGSKFTGKLMIIR
ncbi:MAG: hypothetical protein ACM3UR_04750 [Bacteroidota bacterium]|jgi:hypothetical protein|nr:hypothetical protein [Ignavibacteria bacterium]MCU7499076.1 hypothetical protein [Ignavibacteria bacterium]MCU7512212.1 hypothetical protein [Ignavibacteria bacterium]MCU7521022.1 hypothetical protein [Ignavibacteria bacterium]MCU7524219.1 hypothetical protein [Ignavibacteria bacterium]